MCTSYSIGWDMHQVLSVFLFAKSSFQNHIYFSFLHNRPETRAVGMVSLIAQAHWAIFNCVYMHGDACLFKSANRSPRMLPTLDHIAQWKERGWVFPLRCLNERGERHCRMVGTFQIRRRAVIMILKAFSRARSAREAHAKKYL